MKELFSEGVRCPCETCPLKNEGLGICDACPELNEYLEIKAQDEAELELLVYED